VGSAALVGNGDDLFRGTAHYYARYRKGYAEELFDRLVAGFDLGQDTTILDLGCGTGQLALPFAEPPIADSR